MLSSRLSGQIGMYHAHAPWFATEPGPNTVVIGAGWVVATPIVAARELIGVMYNDRALGGGPVDERQQAAVAIYCSLLAVLCLSLFVIVVDNTIVNVALPTLVRELGTSTSELQWVVDSYTLVFAGLLLTAGSLGDRFGRRGALSSGLLIFGAASAFAAFAGGVNELVAARAVMRGGIRKRHPDYTPGDVEEALAGLIWGDDLYRRVRRRPPPPP